MMLHLITYNDFINESNTRHSHKVKVGKVIDNATNPNDVIRIDANTPDEFIITLNKELSKRNESLVDIKMIDSIRKRLDELDGASPSTNLPYPDNVIKSLKRKLHYYDGNFEFLVSTRKQLKDTGELSNKQWEGVYRSFYAKHSKK